MPDASLLLIKKLLRVFIIRRIEMDMPNSHQSKSTEYGVQDFLPLIVIVSMILLFTATKQVMYGLSLPHAMTDFMGAFFGVFGLFKLMNLSGFVEAYRMYDIVAKRSVVYAYMYPFIEVGLGIAYLGRYQLTVVNVVTAILMVVSSIGVAQEIAKKRDIACACLGVVFKLPMTYVTLAEDVLMGVMALIMLFV